MLKFMNNFSNNKLVVVRRHIADGSCSALIIMRTQTHQKQQNRHYALPPYGGIPPKHQTADIPDCPTPPKPPKSRLVYYGVIGATLMTGAAVVYAKSSPEARNWLESNIPWANNFVALVYQENTTYWKFSINQFNRVTTSISNFLFGKEGVSPLDFQQRSEQDIEADAARDFAKKTYQLPPTRFEPLYIEERTISTPDVDPPATLIQTDKCEPSAPPPVKITKNMVDVELEMHENTKLAIDNYKLAKKHVAEYNKALFKVVESSIGDLDRKYFTTLQGALNEKDAALKKARETSAKAKCALDTLDRMIAAGVAAPPDSIAITKRYIKEFRSDLERAEDEFKAEWEKSVLSDKYWNKVEAARNFYKEELQAIFPGIDLCARKLDVRGDTDLLLIYTLKQVQVLQNELAELQTVRELKINRAIECHDEKAIIEAKVEDMIKAERLQKELEYQKRALILQAEANRVLKAELKKQIEIQQEVQQDKLNRKEQEILGKFNRTVSEKLEKERVAFKKDLAAMAGKMKAIEQTLKQRAKAEAEARRSQSLWAAAEALLAATRRPIPETSVKNEIKALEKAGKDDRLVETVLKSISSDVREKGVITEKALKDKFDKMEKTAAKVALVGREGAALPIYFLSWLQSKMLFTQFSDIPQDELDNLPTDFTKLDTFDIIHRARYHMEHGDLSSALRYVNLLQGGARAAARPWLESAKRHLEVKQAAEAVMAHASVSGLLYL